MHAQPSAHERKRTRRPANHANSTTWQPLQAAMQQHTTVGKMGGRGDGSPVTHYGGAEGTNYNEQMRV